MQTFMSLLRVFLSIPGFSFSFGSKYYLCFTLQVKLITATRRESGSGITIINFVPQFTDEDEEKCVVYDFAILSAD
jgi:hypothetical protein